MTATAQATEPRHEYDRLGRRRVYAGLQSATRRCECGGRLIAAAGGGLYETVAHCEACSEIVVERLGVDNWRLECFECRALFDDHDGPPVPTSCIECRGTAT